MTRARVIVGIGLAALFFAAAKGSSHLSLTPDQLRVFQLILYWAGAQLLIVFAAGDPIGRWALKAMERLDAWILRDRGRAAFLLALAILTYTIFWSVYTFARHYYFHSDRDLGNQVQAVWNTAQGRPFFRSMEVNNDLGDHVRPYLALLSLPYLIFPSPYVLLFFQSSVLALSAWPLYRLAQRKFNSPLLALTVASCVLAYPPLGFLNRADFHCEVIAVPLLIAAYERIDVEDFNKAGIFMGLALLAKENIGLSVAALGLVAAFYHKRWRFGLTWMVVGMAYSLAALFVVIPAFRGAPSDTLARYRWLGDTPLEMLWTTVSHPALWLKHLIAADRFVTLAQLLAPLAFVPLLSLPTLTPAMPALIYNFVSTWPIQQTIYYHYMGPVIPFVGIAAVMGFHRLITYARAGKVFDSIAPGKLRSDQVTALAASIMLLATLASWTYENPIAGAGKIAVTSEFAERISQKGRWARTSSSMPMIQPNDSAIREGLKHVPAEIYVLTTDNYVPHLSHRARIGTITRAPVSSLMPEVGAIFVNLRDLRSRGCDDYLQNLRVAASLGFGEAFYRDGVLVLQRGKGDVRRLKELLGNWPGCD